MDLKKVKDAAILMEDAAKRSRQMRGPTAPSDELEERLWRSAHGLRKMVHEDTGYPINGTNNRDLYQKGEAVRRQRGQLVDALEQFFASDFDVVEEFRELAAQECERLAVLIREAT